MYSFSYLEPVCCSMSSSNCCFLTCIQISQEATQVVWYSHLFPNFPQFIVIHTVKGFGIVNKAEIDVFLELFCFFHDPVDVGNLISGSSAFSKTSLTSGSSRFTYCWSLAWRILSITLLAWDEGNCTVVWAFFNTLEHHLKVGKIYCFIKMCLLPLPNLHVCECTLGVNSFLPKKNKSRCSLFMCE